MVARIREEASRLRNNAPPYSPAPAMLETRDEFEEEFTSLSQEQENFDTTVIDESQQRQVAQVLMATFTLQMAQCGLVDEEKHSSIVYAEEHADEMFEDGKEANFFKMWEEATAKVEWEQQMRGKMKKLIEDGDTDGQMRLLLDLTRTVDEVQNDRLIEHGLPPMPENDEFHNTPWDDELFHPRPPRPDCPICFLPLPGRNETCYQPCCGKTLCDGCWFSHRDAKDDLGEKTCCPFCRDSTATTDLERKKKTEERLKHDDREAFFMLGSHYFMGKPPYKHDRKKGVELLNQAAELGSEAAHHLLGLAHANGEGVEKNEKKALFHLRLAAIGGMLEARYGLGKAYIESSPELAYKHFLIAAEAGHDDSLKQVKTGYTEGHVEKDAFEKVLRAHRAAQEEVKSEAREKAAEWYRKSEAKEKAAEWYRRAAN